MSVCSMGKSTLSFSQIKRNWSFSNLATVVHIMFMYYIDCGSFFEHPEKKVEDLGCSLYVELPC